MSRRELVRFGVIVLTLGLVGGCRMGALQPLERSVPLTVEPATSLIADTRGTAFYPLDLGNRWHYARTFDLHWVDASGVPQQYHQVSAIERELVCETHLGERSYSYQAERTLESEPGQSFTSWVYYRQDRTGLYEFDDRSAPPCASSPTLHGLGTRVGALSSIAEPGRLPDDSAVRAAIVTVEQRLSLIRYTLGLPAPSLRSPQPAAGEIVRLAYPLHTGQRWIIRADPRFTAQVEGVDALHLPGGHFVAYRIRIDSVLFGPNDRVLVWYGPQGFLQLIFHGESEGRDDAGNPIGTVASDDHEVLDGIALVNAPQN